MSSSLIAQVFSAECHARHDHRLVLAAMADAADHAGELRVSERALSQMTALHRTPLRRVLDELVGAGFLTLKDRGGGGRAARYAVTPRSGTEVGQRDDPERCDNTRDWVEEVAPAQPMRLADEVAETIVHARSTQAAHQRDTFIPRVNAAPPPRRNIVPDIVRIAGLKNPTGAPLYWHQTGHIAEAEKLAQRAGGADALIARLERARDAGRIPHGLTRIAALAPVVEVARV